MPLDSKLLESYNNVKTNLVEETALNSEKEEVLNLFRKKAPEGALDVEGTKFTLDMVKGMLGMFIDSKGVQEFKEFLGLGSGGNTPAASLAEENMNSFPPEQVANIIRKYFSETNIKRVVITTKYGNKIVPVSEVWENKGTLNISVELSETGENEL